MGKQFPLVYNKDKVHNDLATKILFQNYTESTKRSQLFEFKPSKHPISFNLVSSIKCRELKCVTCTFDTQ